MGFAAVRSQNGVVRVRNGDIAPGHVRSAVDFRSGGRYAVKDVQFGNGRGNAIKGIEFRRRRCDLCAADVKAFDPNIGVLVQVACQ